MFGLKEQPTSGIHAWNRDLAEGALSLGNGEFYGHANGIRVNALAPGPYERR